MAESSGRSPSCWLLEQYGKLLRPPKGPGYYLQILAVVGWTSALWLPTVRQQTLIMMGTDDPIVPVVNGRLLAALVPHARLVTIADGHLFLVTSARECAPIVADFLIGQQPDTRDTVGAAAAVSACLP
jgi:pimeloyl-ACP methyl ester carboxylesterase